MHRPAGYDVQSAATPDGTLYITGAPRYNHTGRAVLFRLDEKDRVVVTQILKGEQVGHPGFVFHSCKLLERRCFGNSVLPGRFRRPNVASVVNDGTRCHAHLERVEGRLSLFACTW